MVRCLQGWASQRQRAPESAAQPHSNHGPAGAPSIGAQEHHGGTTPHFRAVQWSAVPWKCTLPERQSQLQEGVFPTDTHCLGIRPSLKPYKELPKVTSHLPTHQILLWIKNNRIKCQRWKEFKPLGWIWEEHQAKERLTKFHFIANAVTNLVTLTDQYLRLWGRKVTSPAWHSGNQWSDILRLHLFLTVSSIIICRGKKTPP